MPIHKVKRGVVTEPNVLALCHLVKLLSLGKYDADELSERCGLNRNIVQKYCRGLKQVGGAFIKERRPDARGRFSIIVYQLGVHDDAPRVVRTRAERAREQRKGEAIRGKVYGRAIEENNRPPAGDLKLFVQNISKSA